MIREIHYYTFAFMQIHIYICHKNFFLFFCIKDCTHVMYVKCHAFSLKKVVERRTFRFLHTFYTFQYRILKDVSIIKFLELLYNEN